jgi:hypothetical protein
MGHESDPGTPPLRGASGDTFAALLDRLKRRGTSVLVVGDLPADAQRALSRRMMGHPEEPRYRLLAGPSALEDPGRWFPESVGLDGEWVDVVEHGGLARDAAAVEAQDAGAGPSGAGAVADRVDRWVGEVSRAADPGPGEIRVGVPSLDALLERDGVDAPRTVAERVHSLMRDHQGVAHLYFPRDRSSRVVQQTTVWVDVVVEVRTDGGRPEQRWSVQDTVETSWFPIRANEPHHTVEG